MRLTTLVLPIPPMFSHIRRYVGSLCGAGMARRKGRFWAGILDLQEAGL